MSGKPVDFTVLPHPVAIINGTPYQYEVEGEYFTDGSGKSHTYWCDAVPVCPNCDEPRLHVVMDLKTRGEVVECRECLETFPVAGGGQ